MNYFQKSTLSIFPGATESPNLTKNLHPRKLISIGQFIIQIMATVKEGLFKLKLMKQNQLFY